MRSKSGDVRGDNNEQVSHGNNILEMETMPSSSASMGILQTINEYRESSRPSAVDGLKPRGQWQALLFGQTIAIAAASVNAGSYTLYNLGVVLPIFQISIAYLILSTYLCCRGNVLSNNEVAAASLSETQLHQEDEDDDKVPTPRMTSSRPYTLPLLKIKLCIPWWIYLGMSIIDVEANFMVLLSLQYTSLTSTTLLGSLTVPSVMICSQFLLARTFFPPHYIGVCLCLLGGTLMVWSDVLGIGVGDNAIDNDEKQQQSSTTVRRANSYIGDLLAIAAALLYGLGDTVAEYAIKHIDRAEYLGMLGLFGFVIGGLQSLFLEWDALMDLLLYTSPTRQRQAIATMVWYVASLVFYYVSASYFLTKSDATLMNLSLQTTSLWACLFSVVADGTVPPPSFFVAVVLVTSGVCIYEIAGGNSSRGNETADSSSLNGRESETLALAATRRHGQGYVSIESTL